MSSAPKLLRVSNVEQICEALRSDVALRVQGGGSKRPLWRQDEHAPTLLDVTAFSGVTRYQPEELVLSLRAGTALIEVEALLDAHAQRLAFEPPDFGAVLGTGRARTTMGGVIASGFAGPRRVSAGNVRDHLLGFDAVSGRGECFKAGGRVIKNVTGYDLPKLMCGSWGTLAVLTELTLRVLPKPQHEATLVIESLDDVAAVKLMTQVLKSPLEVSAAAHLPGTPPRTALRLDGFHASVTERLQQLRAHCAGAQPDHCIEGAESTALWRGVRDLDHFARDERVLWRLSLPATESARVVAEISRVAANEVLYDWGGGLVWMAMRATDEASAALVRGEVAKVGGHAWLMRAPEALRERIATAPPQAAGIEALSRRIKDGFDPQNRLGLAPLFSSVEKGI